MSALLATAAKTSGGPRLQPIRTPYTKEIDR
jgi:hypothetical protein